MPIVNVSILKGRTPQAKAAFAKAVTDAAAAHLDVTPPQVRVLITEIEPAHWFVAGESKAPIG
ncbi:4-oxalocrotonate tautomerase family protein [Sphingoaurantiacus capsulatus]|uniref:4-oxalocrotonate tautomerase family protein n=1 Tax=Sphingoaurantiacus capsulatus TaxID=1771310 RepID=A0ABV7XCL9_9SPHN